MLLEVLVHELFERAPAVHALGLDHAELLGLEGREGQHAEDQLDADEAHEPALEEHVGADAGHIAHGEPFDRLRLG